MITASFHREAEQLIGISVSGHAGYAKAGRDIVCAAVSACLEMCANGITEIAGEQADIQTEANRITVRSTQKTAALFMQAFELEMQRIAEQYPTHIRLVYSNGKL